MAASANLSVQTPTKHLPGPAMTKILFVMDQQGDYPRIRDLTCRQIEIMEGFLHPEANNDSVCEKLKISKNTLASHLKEIFSKLGVDTHKKAIWRFLVIYPEYFPKYQLFFLAPAAAIIN